MKRPSDQAKLFLLGLLRTVSALATEPRVFSTAYHHAHHHHHHHHHHHVASVPHITLRLARQRDVPSMQRCNLASLPENYNQQFFHNHMRTWPELTIVAECTTSGGGGGSTQSWLYPNTPGVGANGGEIGDPTIGGVQVVRPDGSVSHSVGDTDRVDLLQNGP